MQIAIRHVGGAGAWSPLFTVPATYAEPGPVGQPWEWPSTEMTIPADAAPGVYLASCSDDEARRETADGRDGRALFVVRPSQASATIGYVLPLFTYHAYNVATYDPAKRADAAQGLYTGAACATLARPGGGVGGHLWDEANADAYDRSSPRQTFAHWDDAALRWLRRHGYAHDVITDWDIHAGASLDRYRLLLFFGHHEYWSSTMRSAVGAFVRGGANVALFSGNTCWFRIEYDEHTCSMRRLGRWTDPEDGLTGLSYAFGGGKWIGERPPTGYHLFRPDHWAFDGCGLRRGNVFGADGRLAGYECDGLAPEPSRRGVPQSVERLAEADLSHWPVADGSGELSASAKGTMILYQRGGTVLNAGTTDWARLLEADVTVSRITQNIVEGLSRDPVPGDRRETALFG